MCSVSECRLGPIGSVTQLLTWLKSDRMEMLEKDRSWREEEFDIVLQYLRTILLKRMNLCSSY